MAGAMRFQLRAALVAGLAMHGAGAASASSSQIAQLANSLQFCTVPNPRSPGGAFNVSQSTADANGDYWVNYSCKQTCSDWTTCQNAAHTASGSALSGAPKQALAFVVDGMGGHLAYTTRQGGDRTVLLHTGTGGTNYMQSLSRQIEAASNAKVVMVRWERGFSGWGWFTRTSAPAARIPNLTRRVASAIAWVHENLAGAGDFGTVGCSMGTQATLGAVYWHGVDDVVDHQLMVGGPGLWDINAGCGRRTYATGFCDLDATRACSSHADCASLSSRSRCKTPATIPLAWLYEQVVNHVHATQACDIATAASSTIAAFDESSFAFAAGGDWDFDHPIDFQMDVWGSDGDERWAMGHAMRVFDSIRSAAGHAKRWHATRDSNHCAAIGNGQALAILQADLLRNQAPRAIGAFRNLTLSIGASSDQSLAGKFEDDGSLRYEAVSSSPSVATASIAGDSVRVQAHAPGTATITVAATDAAGLRAQLAFEVVAAAPNRPPAVVRAFADAGLDPGERVDLSLTGRFQDEGALTYAAASSAPTVATAQIAGASVRVQGIAPGTATVTVTATDAGGLSARTSFAVSVGHVLSFASAVVAAAEGTTATLAISLSQPLDAPLTVRWRTGLDADPASADAIGDIGVSEGALSLAVGEVEASIAIPILDDDDIEPAREFLTVELLPVGANVALAANVAILAIEEGVCDRTPALRDALRDGRPCAALTPADLARREHLDLAHRDLVALRSKDLLGLAALRVLRLQGNRLAELPAGLFEGIATLAELDLRDNPGAPFVLVERLARTDAEPWAPAPAEVSASVASGAPFPMQARLTAQGARLANEVVSLPAGKLATPPIRVFSTGPGAARLGFGTAPTVPTSRCGRDGRTPCFQGLAVRAGPPLVLFKLPPRPTDAAPPQFRLATGDSASVPLGRLFVPEPALTYAVRSHDPLLVGAALVEGRLVLEANDDAADGSALLTVTATDQAGQSTSVSFEVVVEFVPASFLRRWLRALPATVLERPG